MAISVWRGSTKILHVFLRSRGCSGRLHLNAGSFPLPADAWSIPHRGGSHVPVLLLLTSVLVFPSEPALFHFYTRPVIRKLSSGLLQFAFCQICPRIILPCPGSRAFHVQLTELPAARYTDAFTHSLALIYKGSSFAGPASREIVAGGNTALTPS